MKTRSLLLWLAIAFAASLAIWWSRSDQPATPSGPAPIALPKPPEPLPASGTAPTAASARERAELSSTNAERSDRRGLRGRLVDERGQPLPGARAFAFAIAAHDPFELAALVARGAIEPPLAQAIAAADGRFELLLAADFAAARVELRATHAAHADLTPRAVPLEPGVVRDLGDVALGNGYEVRGSAIELGTDAPLVGAEIRLQRQAHFDSIAPTPGRELGLIAHTDSTGAFRLPNVGAGTYVVRAFAAGHGCAELLQQPVGDGVDNVFDLALPPGGAITGSVVDTRGRALGDALVTATARGNALQPRMRARSDAAGRFQIDGLATGDYTLTAAALLHRQIERGPIAMGSRDVLLELPAQGGIDVRVQDPAGRPIVDYWLQARRAEEPGPNQPVFAGVRPVHVTAAQLHDGAFALRGLDPGEWLLEVAAPDFAKTLSPQTTVADGDAVASTTVVVRTGGSLGGTVTDPTGAPIAGVAVELLPASSDGSATLQLFRSLLAFGTSDGSAVTGGDGAFAFAHLAPGVYLVRLRHADHAPRTQRGLRVDDGQHTQAPPIALANGTRLLGTVTLDGQPLADARVQLLAIGAGDLPRGAVAETRSDANGRWSLPQRLGAGSYQLVAGRVEAGNPFLEQSDQAQSRVELTLDGEPERRAALALLRTPPPRPTSPQDGRPGK